MNRAVCCMRLCGSTTARWCGWSTEQSRKSFRSERRFEHRDPQGRLWCVTDESGRMLYAFVWLDDRAMVRLEHGAIAEVFLCDEQSTLLGVCGTDRDDLVVTPVAEPPFGAVSHDKRPTLHGHFGDTATGLICFGARDYDPA